MQEGDWRRQETDYRQRLQQADALQRENEALKQDVARLNRYAILASSAQQSSMSALLFYSAPHASFELVLSMHQHLDFMNSAWQML